MSTRLEDYALIGDCRSAALVSKDGSIDWLCLPRFDSEACLAAILGTRDHGRWQIAPSAAVRRTTRRYRPKTMVLETRYETDEGTVLVVECMPTGGDRSDIVRIVVGERGKVPMRMELVVRFGYGSIVPWVEKIDGGMQAIAGPDLLHLRTPVETRGEELATVAEFVVSEGERVPFVLTWFPSHAPGAPIDDPERAVAETEAYWTAWCDRGTTKGPYVDIVQRSLLTLKALTYAPSGGIVAAPTTSLPEALGGPRNWDYRICWIRDATFTLYSLMNAGYHDEAAAWREWLLRAVAGTPTQLQIMYGLRGERRLTEREIPWLPGYESSRPVRVGNAASEQLQLDVWGELMDALHLARRSKLVHEKEGWGLQRALVCYLETIWTQPDEGIWEVRGPRRHFTHSKVMAWVALDRAVKTIERHDLEGPLDRWRACRDEIHASVLREGYDASRGAFVQYYGGKDLDASLLMIPLVGFLPADDPRVRGTVAALERELMHGGFLARYSPRPTVDGIPSDEGAFLPCSFWLADNYVLQGRLDEARELFERLVGLCNDVGLLSEEYDPVTKRLVGNFPQAFSHVSLVNTAKNLEDGAGPAAHRTAP